MRLIALRIAIVTALLLPCAAAGQADKALLGTWEGWLVDGDGSQESQRRQRISEVLITATQISAKDGRGVSMGTGSYRLGGSGALRTLDATGTGGPTMGKVYLGTYQVSGDTLRWCSGNDRAKTRPPSLKTNTGGGHFLMILTRKK